jgi:hypothetical protein
MALVPVELGPDAITKRGNLLALVLLSVRFNILKYLVRF